MHAPSPAAYATTLRWAHVPLAMFVLSIVWFVHFHFDAGRLWLAWAACGFRLLALALNFVHRREHQLQRSALRWTSWCCGATSSSRARSAVANPWAIVPQIGNLLLARVRRRRLHHAVAPRRCRCASPCGRRRRRRRGLHCRGRRLRRADHAGAGACADDRHAGCLRDRPGHGLRTGLGPDRGGTAGDAPARQRDAFPRRRRSRAERDPSGRRQGHDRAGQCAGGRPVRLPARRAGGHAGRPAGARALAWPRTPACARAMRRTRRREPMGAGRELFACRKDGSEIPGGGGAESDGDRRGPVRAGLGGRHHRPRGSWNRPRRASATSSRTCRGWRCWASCPGRSRTS